MTCQRQHVRLAVSAVTMFILASVVRADNWPQFRGPNGSGHPQSSAALPIEFGPEQNVVWKTPLPRGLSSPSVWGDRIFVTAFRSDTSELVTIALDRESGEILWEQVAPAESIEKVHRRSSPATATPATDGERVYVYFGSCGLFCYDMEGRKLWQHPLPTAQKMNGSGTSPIVHQSVVLLSREDSRSKYLLALDAVTGRGEVEAQSRAVLWAWYQRLARSDADREWRRSDRPPCRQGRCVSS